MLPAGPGAGDRGEKHLPAALDGIRESTRSRREVLPGLKSRGMNVPELAIGDGAMGPGRHRRRSGPGPAGSAAGFTRVQMCRVPCRNRCSSTSRGGAARDPEADTKEHAERAFDLFIDTYADRYPKVAHCLTRDRGQLMTFHDFPARHRRSIRTTNPTFATFATIRHRTRRPVGCLTRAGMLNMIFRPGPCARGRWRRLHGFGELGKVITGVKSGDGIEMIEDAETEDRSADQPAGIAA